MAIELPEPGEPAAAPGPAPAPGSATGIGSAPGEDVREAFRVVLGELPDLPHLPELPARGPGADMVGRAVGLLAGLHGDVQPAGWRLVDVPGRDERRAVSWLGEDLDAAEELAGQADGAFKVQVCGPLTLAASLELPRGGRALADAGARRDLTASLAEGVAEHVAAVRRRLPRAAVVLQLDEPGMTAVLDGRVPTASGLGRLAALDRGEALQALRAVIDAAGAPVVVHSCAPAVDLRLVREAGARGVSLDASLLTARDEEPVGEALEAGLLLLLGLVPSVEPPAGTRLSGAAATVDPARRLWHRLGLAPERLASSVVVTPACGLAGASPAYFRRALALARAAGKVLTDDPEG
ncbi:uroporphyrinogen decarboxylase/cobalamine-independent methonine synthase family protein [Motilibacter aurantiacus]|uniref:methionine synthase n=1 Tax=Motilibacter aurantiacus TaxID=2714955 RepID=UPI0014080E46|nr:methionine synthase [Motilibacter aurantiacus]NHC44703.1 methionine synthase [Motilibacter aurantiacus]